MVKVLPRWKETLGSFYGLFLGAKVSVTAYYFGQLCPKEAVRHLKMNWNFVVAYWKAIQIVKYEISDPYFLKFLWDPIPVLALKVIPSFNPHFEFCLKCWICQSSYMDFSCWSHGFAKIDTWNSPVWYVDLSDWYMYFFMLLHGFVKVAS